MRKLKRVLDLDNYIKEFRPNEFEFIKEEKPSPKKIVKNI